MSSGNPASTALPADVAEKILDADFQNVVRKVAAGKPLTVAERARIEARAAAARSPSPTPKPL
jgi:antitoxin (DNA-binding transcriptional repressor) of toxin-antitoxin stability system